LFRLKNKNFSIFSFQANIYAVIFARIFKINILTRSNSAPEGWSKNLLKKFIFKLILKQANKIIVNSHDFKKSLFKHFELKSECIYNPLDRHTITELSKERINFKWFKNTKIKIINIGRFTDQKDHMTLLESIKKASKKLNLKLLILGRGKNKQLMIDYINKHNLHSLVKIINFKNNPYPYLKLSNLFILTSRFEGLPNVLLEAMQLKKYIISTNCPTGPKEILMNGKFGSLVPIENANSIADSIHYYSKNKKNLFNKISNGFKSLNRFNYEKNLNKYYNQTKKIL